MNNGEVNTSQAWQSFGVSFTHSVNQSHTHCPTQVQVLHRLKVLHY